jgi:hypothetical protein
MNKFIAQSVLLMLLSTVSFGQISPGDLTDSHAEFEGMGNCTLCHELGAKVTDQKCLDCHKEINSLMTQDKGFHASSQVESKNCFQCHSEHHGRNFDMIRFNKDAFNHNLTGYPLEGKHATIDCRECHAPENITDASLRNREGTFLGLDQQCLSCHDDFHQGTLSTDCKSCHNFEAFSPAVGFNHETADFKLRGKHIVVDCKECHQTTTKNGREFQQFTNMAFNDCKACHDDPHNGNIPGACAQCHTENSFNTFMGRGNFNHNTTDFTLKGSHKSIDCFACHAETNNVASIFQDRTAVEESNCISCHTDQHDGKFGNDCAKCHNEESFLALNNMDFFDHSVTDYPLEGMHQGIDCRECHTDRFTTPIDFSECKSCHSDYHNGEFAENGISPDCAQCHSLEKGFEFTLFTIDDHNQSGFPLEGAHVATPCFACHVDEREERWTFANMGSSCVDCHVDFHEGAIAQEYYPQNDCTQCHSSEAWDAVAFDHNSTDWPLTGEHSTVSCSACHFEYAENNEIISQNFSNLSTDCASCHDNVHGDDFAIDGVTDCARCHITSSWVPEKFDHDQTRFPLVGKHEEVDCKACHEIQNAQGVTIVEYQLGTLECIDCHQ